MMPRLDRIASLYFASPLLRLGAEKLKRAIPILMYHSVADEDESGVRPYYKLATSPAKFFKQMGWLHDQGFHTVDLPTAVQMLKSDGCATTGTVVITFDDGYRNFCWHALPILERFGFTATIFLPSASIGDRPIVFNRRECMTWGDVRNSLKRGVSFGSHTVNHLQLYKLPRDQIREELLRSRQAIEDNAGLAIDSFAYPYAFPQTDQNFKAMLRGTLEESGYKYGVCTQIGSAGAASDPLFLKRLPVNHSDDNELFRAKIEGSYDWVGSFQSLAKRMRWACAKGMFLR